MRLKIYTAGTVADAMRQIRQDLGDDAVIVSTETEADGVRITAAIDNEHEAEALAGLLDEAPPQAPRGDILEALAFHGVPEALAGEIAAMATGDDRTRPVALLEAALREGFDFAPLDRERSPRPLMMVGTPGAGKTLTTAKLAARATMDGHAVRVVSTDSFRAGAREQLAAFTDILSAELVVADGPDELRAVVEAIADDTFALVDTAGANPFDPAEMAALARLIEVGGAEPVLVMAAGGDTVEAVEIATQFGALGVRRLVATRLDVARRLGAMLVAADSGPFAFAEASASPQVAHGLGRLSPLSLARLLMRETVPSTESSSSEKATAQ